MKRKSAAESREQMLDYSDYVTIKIIKVKDELGNFLHWESDTQFSDNSYSASCSGPTYYGVIDEALDYIRDVAQYWSSSDSNEKGMR